MGARSAEDAKLDHAGRYPFQSQLPENTVLCWGQAQGVESHTHDTIGDSQILTAEGFIEQ